MSDPTPERGQRRVLVVAYYFPPMGLSGVQRTAKLVKYLPAHGWIPTVLTARPAGYFAFDPDLAAEVDAAGVEVHRTASLDPTRLFGRVRTVALPDEQRRSRLARLSQLIFVPDNKIGWLPSAVRTGRRIMKDVRFDAVLSTAPPYTGHLIARRLADGAGVPLVLDFRDDWLGNPRHEYPTRWHRKAHAHLERRAMKSADAVLTINGTIASALAARNPGAPVPVVVPQGYDPEDYPARGARPDHFTLIYTGVFYDAQRPDAFLEGLAAALARRPDMRSRVRARFVGLFPDPARERVGRLGLDDVVDVGPYVTHREAMRAVCGSSVAWLVVGRRPGAEQISTGKLYAYMGAHIPILALAPQGEVRRAVEAYGAGLVVDPDRTEEISHAIETLFDAWREDRLPSPTTNSVAPFDRKRLAGQVAGILDTVCSGRDGHTPGS